MQFQTVDFHITPFDGTNPPVTKPDPKFLHDIGEEGMRTLLRNFYTKLYHSPIADLFEEEFEAMMQAAQNSAGFFIQICGGPKYFNKRRGAPQMRGRHAPFRITPTARLHWLTHFEEAIKEEVIEKRLSDPATIQSFWNYLDIFSLWMINTPYD